MRRVGSVLIMGGAMLLGGAGIAQAASTMVEAQDFEFSPKTISIDPGDSITFTNTGDATHTATADNGSFDTGDIKPGATQTITVKAPGTYPFYCKYHGGPGGVGMSGTITVGNGGSTKSAPQTATPLPFIGAAGAILLGFGLLLTRRRTQAG
jgi:LPXTG-motif cell wall-anchored protein